MLTAKQHSEMVGRWHIGLFSTAEEAHRAYVAEADRLREEQLRRVSEEMQCVITTSPSSLSSSAASSLPV